MDSPFPGMDPYLEQHWRSVHQRLITYAGDQLQAILPRQFRVDVEERVFVAGDGDERRTIWPDVHVVERPKPGSSGSDAASATAIAEPVVLELLDEPVTETYLEIVDATSGNRVITAIEFLSPTNKLPGDGNDLYVRKQREYRSGGVNQVEIDLTRQGDRSAVFPLASLAHRYRSLYLAWVRRSWQPTKVEVYPLPLQQPLPAIGIPLGSEHADVPLDLQAIVTQCYRNGRYADIDYRRPLQPPLPAQDAAWADEFRRSRVTGSNSI
ncbi:MAG: DUF4058 family protein [Pirellulaceae bacterium]|nr:DUF4058 family protein [Pirellulaceae bacterium]